MNIKKLNWYLSGGPTSSSIATAFETRVEADSGLFEGSSCLQTEISALGSLYNQATFILTPNGYKVSKLYALKPTDGTGDLTFTRSTPGYRKNATYLQEMGLNTPRLDYLGSSCPSLLLEPARTNLALRSEEMTNAAWTKLNATAAQVASPGNIPEMFGADNLVYEYPYIWTTANSGDAVEKIDVTDPYNPVHVTKAIHGGSYLLDGPLGIVKHPTLDILYVSAITSDAVNILSSVDLSFLGSIVTGAGGADLDSPWNLTLTPDGLKLYAATAAGLEIMSVSVDGLTLVHLGKVALGSNQLAVKISGDGNTAWVACFSNDRIFGVNVSNPASPTVVATIIHNGVTLFLDGVHGLHITGSTLYAASRTSQSLTSFDISIPAVPVLLDTLTGLNGAADMQQKGNNLYVACFDGNLFAVVDITDPSNLSITGTLADGAGGAILANADMVWVDPARNFAYVTGFPGSIEVVDISVDATPTHAARVISNSFSILETTANNVHLLRQAFTKSTSQLSYVMGLVVKGGLGRDWICLQGDDGTNLAGKFFNITTGALGNDRTAGTGYSIQDSRIINLGDAGYLCLIRITSSTSTTLNLTALISTDGATITYTGDAAKGFYVRKGHVVQTTTPITDSYIFGTTVAVARTADALTALTSVSAMIGQTEGTIKVKGKFSADGVSKAFSISDGTLNNRVTIEFTTGNLINLTVVAAGVQQASISNAGFVNNTEYDIIGTYVAGRAALQINSVLIGEDLTVTVPSSMSRIGPDSGAGASPLLGDIIQLLVSPTKVTI